MARRFVEIVTSDLTGEEVEQADTLSFVWGGVKYELDVGPRDEPGEHTLNHLIEVSRVAPIENGNGPKPAKAAKSAAASAAPSSVKKRSDQPRGQVGRIKGAPVFSPTEYFAMFGKVEPSGRKHWNCPFCEKEVEVYQNEVNANEVTKFRQHVKDMHDKLLWVTAAKKRHKTIPAGYEDRG